jgi:NAD dependent epimerase/dehydratase
MTSFWHDKLALVTGAGGFIGSHLCEALVQRGARVRGFVRYNGRADDGMLNALPDDIRAEVETLRGDLRDQSAVRAAVNGVDIVFHLGALIAIPYSYQHPEEVISTNVNGTLNVLLAARDAGTGRVVHTSTSEVYGTAQTVPMDETHPLQGQSPYSASKIAADKLAESFYRSFDLPVVTVRPFNTYGPRQSLRAVVPTIIAQVLFHDVLRLGNLDARRDLTFVADTVEGFLRAAEGAGVDGETFNVGSGEEIAIQDLAQRVANLVGKPLSIECDPSRLRPEKSEVQRLLSDSRRAQMRLHWEPKVGLDDGLERTIEWVRDHCSFTQTIEYRI